MNILTKRMSGVAIAAAMVATPTLAAAAPAKPAPATSLSVVRAARVSASAAKKSKLGGNPIGIVATVGIIAGAAGLIYLATKSGNDPFELGDSN